MDSGMKASGRKRKERSSRHELQHGPDDNDDEPFPVSDNVCADLETDPTKNEDSKDMTENPNSMNTADWRWAADKGFWDPLLRCWNENLGGMKAYIAQRNHRRAARAARLRKKVERGLDTTTDHKPRTSKCMKNLMKPCLRFAEGEIRPCIRAC
jgi:hypothetical protein